MSRLEKEIILAKEALLNHQVVAFPTETVMGLGVIFDDYDAYNLLNEIKNRPEDKPYTMMVKDTNLVSKYCFVDEKINRVIKAFMPGSITLLLKARDNVPSYVTHNTGVIGIRIPTNVEAVKLLEAVDKPLLVPSANKSGERPALNSLAVKAIFKDEVKVVITGLSKGEVPSTIVDLSSDKPLLVREGPINYKEIVEVYENE